MHKAIDERCLPPIQEALSVLGGKWSFLVLTHLSISPMRFNQLRRNLDDISTKALTDTLRHLENNGVIHRQVFPTVPVTVEYSLTEKGKDFRTVLIAMYHWGKTWGKWQDVNDQDHPMTQETTTLVPYRAHNFVPQNHKTERYEGDR